MNIRTQYDKIGEKYIEGQRKFFASRRDEAREFIRKNLGNLTGKRVLDIGCGGGADILTYEKLKADVYGIDPSRFMVNAARKVVSQPNKIKIGSAEKIPFNKSFFDVATARFSLHHVTKLDKEYKEIFRVLKPKGLLLTVVDHPIRDLLLQKNKVYGKQEVVHLELYVNAVRLHFPSHTLSDYFSKTFFELFTLNSVYEDESKKIVAKLSVMSSTMLGFKATKK